MGSICVALPGPPCVRMYTTDKSVRVKTVSNRKPTIRMGKIIGATTFRKRWKKLQPSTLAASRTSGGTEVNRARRTIAENGKVRHTLTPTQAIRASFGSPSHTGHESVPYCPMSPIRLSTQLKTLNCESYIHFHAS